MAMGCILVAGGRTFLPISGVLYLLGVIFYLWKKYPYNSAVWHFFALAAAVCHYVAILLAVQQPVLYQTFFLYIFSFVGLDF